MNRRLIMFRTALAFLLSAGLAVSSLAQATPAPEAQTLEQVVVKVNDEAITSYDLRQRVRMLLASTQIQEPGPEIVQALQSQALRTLIDETIQLQQAKQFELEVPEEAVRAELAQLAAQQNVSAEDLLQQFVAAGIDPMTLLNQVRAQWAWRIIVRNRFAAERTVSDSEIDDAMEQLVVSASQPRFQLSEMLIAIPPGTSQEQTNQFVTSVYQQLQSGAPFPALARQISSAPSAPQGGDVGWVSADALEPAVLSVVRQLEPGRVSPPIDTQDGIYIVALRDREEGADVYNLRLKQVLVPVAGRDNIERAYQRGESFIERISERAPSCDSLEQDARRVSRDALVTDLGIVRASDLSEEYNDIVRETRSGRLTRSVRSASGAVALMVCERSVAEGADLPSREQIENSIAGEKLDLAARRYLRDLRDDATIEPDIRF
jgi:peptidyl-prolyl cis-trans isomerase SurA